MDLLPDLAVEESSDQVVRVGGEEDVGVGAEPDVEPAAVPVLLEQRLALLVGRVRGALLLQVELEPEVRLLDALADPRPVLPPRGLDLGVHRAVVRRHDVVRRPLEHRQLAGLRREQRDRLHGAGSGADQPDALSGEVDALVRPVPGVERRAREGLEARERRGVRRRQRADRGDHVGRRDRLAGVGRDGPDSTHLVEGGGVHAGPEGDVLREVEALRDVLQVRADLVRLGVALAPLPGLPELPVEGEAVDVGVGVRARSRVAVPVPGAPDAVAGLEDPGPQSQLVAKLVEHVEAGEAGPDDHRVDRARRVRARRARARRHRRRPPAPSRSPRTLGRSDLVRLGRSAESIGHPCSRGRAVSPSSQLRRGRSRSPPPSDP